jgi:glycosyltransferase involved in cell wall biosynthesis
LRTNNHSLISFIIPAHNEQAVLDATLTQLIASANEVKCEYEIIVVDDASTDLTGEIAQTHGAKLVRVEYRQIAATRNAGARHANGNILIFIDADTLVGPATLAAAMTALDSGVTAGGATVHFDADVGLLGRLFVGSWNTVSRIMGYAAGCFIFTRHDAFITIGGFDEQYFASEEIWLSRSLKRVGRLVILPEHVITSARKVRMHSPWRWIPMVFKLILMGPRSWRSRDHLWMWYDGKRE